MISVEVPADGPRTLSVAELDRSIRRSLEDAFASPVWVEGEVVGARPAASGHCYFTLKDEKEDASIDVAIYRSSVTPRMRGLLVDGARVRLRGRPSFWAPRGRLQFVADRADAAGRGAPLEALEKLKARLAAEGLFAPERKRKLPKEPRRIGVVTSRGGAVIHDICKVAFRRGGACVLLAPAAVQGVGAAASMVQALSILQKVMDVDVVIIGRGGGSSDDLSAFNDEALVRAVAACRVPVVSAVGHEVDVTLVDFVADARAATPSQAAELVVRDEQALRMELRQLRARLGRAVVSRIGEGRVRLVRLERKLGDPRLALLSYQQLIDEHTEGLFACERKIREGRKNELLSLGQRLAFLHPRSILLRDSAALAEKRQRLATTMRARLERRVAALGAATGRLDALSPLKVLSRGYAIATHEGRAVRSGKDVAPGDAITIRVQDARIDTRVVAVEEET